MHQVWPANMNTCPDWVAEKECSLALKEEYLRHACRVCALANKCWPGIHEGSVHSMQSGQSILHDDKKAS